MVIYLDSNKQVIMWDLTVLWVENMEEAHEGKRVKYQELVEQCRSRGWRVYCEPMEVGCRVFARRSICRVLTPL